MPTSNYLITRFFDNFVLVETDLFFFCFDRLSGLLSSKFYFSYFLSIINSFFYNRFVFRSRRFLSKRVGYSRFFSNRNYESFFLSHLYNTFFFLFSINRVNINKLKARFLYLISFFLNRICFSRFFKFYSSLFFLYANNFSSRKHINFFSCNLLSSRLIFSLFFSRYVRYQRNSFMHILWKNNVVFLDLFQ